MMISKSVKKSNEEWYSKTVQIFERSYRTDASFVISHIKSAQLKFTCQGYLITAAKGKPLQTFSGECQTIEKHLQNSKIPYSQLITFQNNRSLCIYRSDCHNCTDILPHLAADCPRALPGKKRACLTSHQTGSCETHLMSLISFPDNQFHSHQVSL